MRAVVLMLSWAACSYQAPGIGSPDGPSGGDDAEGDGPSQLCTPSTVTCSGRTLQTCDASGQAFASEVTCPLSCDVDHCTRASNVEVATQAACVDTAPAFVATAASTAIAISGPDHALSCSDCNTIVPQRVEVGRIDMLVYCMSALALPANQTLSVESGVDAAVVLIVAGDVVVDGTIDLRGETVGNSGSLTFAVGGSGGSPGGVGANAANGPGNPGGGTCGGGGGASSAGASNVGGGGGGGGLSTPGAAGGVGTESDGATTAASGVAGELCTTPPASIEPLIGGSGGGSGGDGLCNVTICGRPGGGGGGAIQISATGTLTLGGGGSILAGGGAGGFSANAGNVRGGGGGGGAGGAILLEAPALAIAGTLDVRGGDGGSIVGLVGGPGGTPFVKPDAGASGGADQGAGGGGGALGRIRLNAGTGATCPTAVVSDPCTTNALTPAT